MVKARMFIPFSESIFVALASRPGLFSANSVICFNILFVTIRITISLA
jgi:hypothetical protein